MSDIQAVVALFSTLSNEHLWCLINCHSYRKFWWYLRFFLQGKCPLCELPEEIYPRLDQKKRRNYQNHHWLLVRDTLAETQFRIETILMVYKEHVCGFDWNTIFSNSDATDAYNSLQLYLAERSLEVCGTFVGRLGNGKHSVETASGHFNLSFVIPDEKGDIYAPIFKGPERQKFIRARALRFAWFYFNNEPAKADEEQLEMKYATKLAEIYPLVQTVFDRIET